MHGLVFAALNGISTVLFVYLFTKLLQRPRF
jgi:hypothetical protein